MKKGFPGYERTIPPAHETPEQCEERMKALFGERMKYRLPEDITSYDMQIPFDLDESYAIDGEIRCQDTKEVTVRVYKPAGLADNSPVLMNVHGGAWMAEGLNGDDFRCAELAKATPCIVVSVNYHGSRPDGSMHFPQPLLECVAAYKWLCENAAQLGGDQKRIAIHGSSSGANFCAGLALYFRDHHMQTPALTVLNCPCVSTKISETMSYWQNIELHPGNANPDLVPEAIYLNGYNGHTPNYYAYPGYAHILERLGPHFVITAEYDTLRDDGLNYARRLLDSGVQTEILSAPRQGHCFTGFAGEYTDMTNQLIGLSLRAEFGMM